MLKYIKPRTEFELLRELWRVDVGYFILEKHIGVSPPFESQQDTPADRTLVAEVDDVARKAPGKFGLLDTHQTGGLVTIVLAGLSAELEWLEIGERVQMAGTSPRQITYKTLTHLV